MQTPEQEYKNTLDWMFSCLPMYQRQGASAYRKDLDNIRLLCAHLGHPERRLKCIHVAGTNGKGSTSHMLASVLQEAGYRTGLFTSPHLVDFRERIRIDGQMIPQLEVTQFVDRHRHFFESHDMSFFEMTTGLAFDYFSRADADICVIETGMGGRLDSTNVILPILSVITNIGMDHVQFLGDTPEAIAREKAGIIKPGIPVVVGQAEGLIKKVLIEVAEKSGSHISFADENRSALAESDLKGHYQRHNIRTVMTALSQLRQTLHIDPAHIEKGLLHVVKNTGLRGRWEKLSDKPLAIADTAHNADGLRETMAQVAGLDHENLHIVLGAVNDKDLADIMALLPQNARYYYCRPDIPRGLDAHILKAKSVKFGLSGAVYGSVREAYVAALAAAGPDDVIYVGGSTFVVAEIL